LKGNRKQGLFLGLDTSAYTTSLALVDRDERLHYDSRIALPVKEGTLGLRQSDAVYAHILNLSSLWKEKVKPFENIPLEAIAAATRPRPVEGSYMPVFKVSEALGLFFAQAMSLLFIPSSHQEGHIMAGLWSAGLPSGRYLVIHLSGGTTEIIDAEEVSPGRLELKLLGGSSDLNAGQFVDRIGKLIGLGFPAGPELEKMAKKGQSGALDLPVAVKKGEISFSGPASHAERLLKRGCCRKDLARAVERCIADSLAEAVKGLPGNGGCYGGLLTVGGVTANLYIRKRLEENLAGWKLYHARPEYASDNAVGLAVQASRLSGFVPAD
jgi:N6-L-threonylcarbamoyladenine synthase